MRVGTRTRCLAFAGLTLLVPSCSEAPLDSSQSELRVAFIASAHGVSPDPYNGSPRAIYTMNSDATDMRLLADSIPPHAHGLSATSNGEIFIFGTGGGLDSSMVVVIQSDGNEMREIAEGGTPAINSQGTKVAAVAAGAGADIRDESGVILGQRLEIFTLNPDGSERTQITFSRDFGGATAPQFSPNGEMIVFQGLSYSDGGRQYPHGSPNGIFIMHADGSDVRKLLDTGHAPVFVSDSEILYVDYSPNGLGVHSLDLAKSDVPTFLAQAPGGDDMPEMILEIAVSPDSELISMVTMREDDTPRLYVMNLDGSNLTEVAAGPSEKCCAAWFASAEG